MPQIKVTIDNTVVMDGDLGSWTDDPPEILTEQLKAGARPAPHMRALLGVIAEVALTGKNLQADVQTRTDGWALTVNHSPQQCNARDEPPYAVVEDAIWQALDSEQAMPHSGVDPFLNSSD
jgi:hypothetical protein